MHDESRTQNLHTRMSCTVKASHNFPEVSISDGLYAFQLQIVAWTRMVCLACPLVKTLVIASIYACQFWYFLTAILHGNVWAPPPRYNER